MGGLFGLSMIIFLIYDRIEAIEAAAIAQKTPMPPDAVVMRRKMDEEEIVYFLLVPFFPVGMPFSLSPVPPGSVSVTYGISGVFPPLRKCRLPSVCRFANIILAAGLG